MLPIKPRMLVKARFVSKTAPSLKFSPSCKDCKWSTDNGNICILFKVIYLNQN